MAKIRVIHKPCGYHFSGETLTLVERHYCIRTQYSTVQYSDRATVLDHVRFLPQGHIADARCRDVSVRVGR